MKEMTRPENNEVKNNTLENLNKFKSELGTTISEAKSYIEDLFKDINDGFYTDYKDRYDRLPNDGEFGHWEGEKGESKYIPSPETEKGRAAIAKLAEYGMDGIEYKNCEPDYSKCNEGTVKIDNMTEHRYKNFEQADEKLAEQWNKDLKDGKSDWKDKDVYNYRKENLLSWHECCDTKTMHLLSRDIHGASTSVFLHSGGVAECKARDNKNSGGGFDE